jgi:uncharacterized protein YjbI with pentapeptide repeats
VDATATPSAAPARPTGRRRWLSPSWLLADLAVVAVLLTVVLVLPALLYPPLSNQELDRDGVTGKDRVQLRNDRLKLQNDARATLLQGLGGAVLLLGAYFTWRQLQIAHQQQITERFTRAIEQLDTNAHHTDVVIGGIYALERIARDSPDDRATIGEVLTAYIRGHAPWPPRLERQPAADVPSGQLPRLRARAPDVQAALTVLGRGGFAADGALDLTATDLRHADLEHADLHGANLLDGSLRGAFLVGANLEGAPLTDLQDAICTNANLREAALPSANLRAKSLNGADLQRAILIDADLRDASIFDADLRGAMLDGADLQAAQLSDSDLREASLRGANLTGAFATTGTRWPDGFDPNAAGVIILDDDPGPHPDSPG